MPKKPAKKPAKKPVRKREKAKLPRVLPDRDEAVTEMEPMLVTESSKHRARLNELVFNLVAATTALKAALPEGMVEALSDIVRSMNCYS